VFFDFGLVWVYVHWECGLAFVFLMIWKFRFGANGGFTFVVVMFGCLDVGLGRIFYDLCSLFFVVCYWVLWGFC